MNYSLFRMIFTTPLHIGDSESANSLDTGLMSFCADTLFSALCHTALTSCGNEGITRLYNSAMEDRLLFSDSMPFKESTLYIKKPYISSKVRIEIKIEERKAMKKLAYIPVDGLSNFFDSINGKKVFKADDIDNDFGTSCIIDRVCIKGKDKTELYSVGQFSFYENTGLYVIIGYTDESELQYLKKLFYLLGLSGIGGEVSSGFGKFDIDVLNLEDSNDTQAQALKRMLNNKNASRFISLTSALPKEDELEAALAGSSYSLIRRGGFVQSETYHSRPLKKPTQYFFSAGSVFRKTFKGDVYDISIKGKHAVYRYSKPVFLGVDI